VVAEAAGGGEETTGEIGPLAADDRRNGGVLSSINPFVPQFRGRVPLILEILGGSGRPRVMEVTFRVSRLGILLE